MKFLLYRAAMLNSETHIPSPALLGHNHDRLLERMTAWAKSVGARERKPFGEIEVERNMPPSWIKLVTPDLT
ncbi:MAG TPA: hypothetical protein VK988_14630 [Acidimicrobiales bacterium]|nr:hypothetical protein [Acidimicrobiales bacterium]